MAYRLFGLFGRRALQRDATGVPLRRHVYNRTFTSTAHQEATYRRFGQGVPQRPSGLPTADTSNATPLQQLFTRVARRGGGDGGQGGGFKRGGKNNQRYTIVLGIVGLGGGYYVFHLERVPDTGRWRFIDISRKQELAIGNDTFQQTIQQYRGKILPSSDKRVRYVRSIAERIVNALHHSEYSSDHMNTGSIEGGMNSGSSNSSREDKSANVDDVEWEVFVIEDPQMNAFVTSNGKIFVYTGILPICKDEDGLATVLGHEIAHQLARHVAEKVSGFKVFQAAVIVLQMLNLDIGISQAGLTLLLSLPNSRKVEMEADQIGLQLMSKACFDPTKAPLLWQRMEQAEGNHGGKITESIKAVASTHPLSKKRMTSLQQQLPQAIETRKQSGCPDNAAMGAFQSANRQMDSFMSRSPFS